ncbi:MAG: NYN domain-containing protein [Lachnospiraceae bacterium]|nr:NYN domain-containing protein [Lachnospiraceae bacterium]
MEERKYALLIDAENTSPKYVDVIISELKKYGVITYQRMYGDFTNPDLAGWNKKALKYAIVPIQQSRYSTAKNAADIMLVIDAMDILYQDKTDGFCIVTSDSDFTRLVSRLREEGKSVIGMGKSDASKTFIAACDEYKFLDKIVDDEAKADKPAEKDSITPIGEIKSAINNLLQECENNGEPANLGMVKSNLQRLYPDFDERNYGYNAMMKFITEATKFKIVKQGSTILVVRGGQGNSVNVEENVQQYIIRKAEQTIKLEILGQQLHEHFPDFKYKDYGYARLSRYVSSIEGVQIDSNNIVTRQ